MIYGLMDSYRGSASNDGADFFVLTFVVNCVYSKGVKI